MTATILNAMERLAAAAKRGDIATDRGAYLLDALEARLVERQRIERADAMHRTIWRAARTH